MSLQRVWIACLLGLAVILVGAAVQLSVAKAQEELVEVIPEWGLHVTVPHNHS